MSKIKKSFAITITNIILIICFVIPWFVLTFIATICSWIYKICDFLLTIINTLKYEILRNVYVFVIEKKIKQIQKNNP